MPSLEQERIASLLEELRDEVGLVDERTSRREAAGSVPNQVDVTERANEIVCEVARFRAEQDEIGRASCRERVCYPV